jgi:hypothetical protein
LTRKAPARYHAPVPITVLWPSLHELVDIIEQIFTIAATCDLRDVMSEDWEAAIHGYRAAHGLTATRLRDVLRSSLAAMREPGQADTDLREVLATACARGWHVRASQGALAR